MQWGDEVFADLTGYDKKTDKPIKGVHSGLERLYKIIDKRTETI